MPKIDQALVLEPPSELHFKGPFTDVTTSYLNLSNPTEKQVCFKVKTTAPKTYCVRPNSGIVPPKESVIVAVMLQPFDIESADRSKHKFMVQTMFAPDGEFNQDTLWRDAAPESLMNSKLRCVFDVPGETVQNNVETTEAPKEEVKESIAAKPSTTETFTVYTPKTSNLEVEFKKLLESNKKLKEELNEVLQENSRLKEEGLRLRVSRSAAGPSVGGTGLPATGLAPDFQNIDQPSYRLERQQIPEGVVPQKTLIIIFAFIIFLLGFYIGSNVL